MIDTVPSYVTRDAKLEPTTIKNYISKLNVINKLMVGNPLSSNVKKELLKLLNSKVFDESLLMYEMISLNYVEQVIKALPFTSNLIACTVVLSHIPSLRIDDLKITTLAKDRTKQGQAIRDLNETDETDKIIGLSNRQTTLDKIKKLPIITDKLIYALNTFIRWNTDLWFKLMKHTHKCYKMLTII